MSPRTVLASAATTAVIVGLWLSLGTSQVSGDEPGGQRALASPPGERAAKSDLAKVMALVDEVGERVRSATRVDAGRIHALLSALGAAFDDGSLRELAASEPARVDRAVDLAVQLLPAAPAGAAAFFTACYARHLNALDQASAALAVLDALRRSHPACVDYAVALALARAQCLRRLGRFDAAMDTVDEALAAAIDDPIARADLLAVRASIYIDVGVFEQALVDLGEVQRVAGLSGDQALSAAAIVGRADCDLGRGRHDLVRDRVSAALERPWRAEFAAVLAIYLGLGWMDADPDEARRLLAAAVADPALHRSYRPIAEVQLARIAAQLDGATIGRVAAASPRLNTWISEQLLDSGAPRAALLAQLSSQQAAFEDLLRAWRHAPLIPTGTSFLRYQERRRRVRALAHLRMAVNPDDASVAAAFEDLMRAQAMSSHARLLDAVPVSLGQVREHLLSDRSGVLVYLPTPIGSDLFAVDRDGIVHVDLEPDVDLEERIRDFERLLARDGSTLDSGARAALADRLAELGSDLGSRLLPPEIETRLDDWDAVTISGAGLWWNLTFEALVRADGRLLGTTHAVTSLASLPFGVARSLERGGGGDREVALLVALAPDNPEFSAQVGTPTGFAAADVRELLGSSDRQAVCLGPDCTPAAFVRALSRQGGVTQAIAHGVFDADRREFGLALHGGTVWPEDLRGVDAAGLVFLSTCRAGNSRFRPGDDDLVDSLAGALLGAGSRAVIVSKNDVTLGPHLRLSARFHRALGTGVSAAEAMRAARTEAAEDRLEAFEFAQIQVFGLGQEAAGPR